MSNVINLSTATQTHRIELSHNVPLAISIAQSRASLNWRVITLDWAKFSSKLSEPVRSSLTIDEYLALNRTAQDNEKDVGGYVAGKVEKGRRNKQSIADRSVIMLDLDNIPAGSTNDILNLVDHSGIAAAVHSTRKHQPHAPRLRLAIPMAEALVPEEYEAAARFTAQTLGVMAYADPTTFQANRLMFWPSVCKDAEYIFRRYDRPILDAKALLAQIPNWQDAATWPQAPAEPKLRKNALTKQSDPLAKEGIVGAFCRSFSITEAIAEFLPDVYKPTSHEDRWSFAGGSTSGGAVVYDDKFLYSHHATDPCSMQLVNSFDLIRNHLFGDADNGAKAETPDVKLPSYDAMVKWAAELPSVAEKLHNEATEKSKTLFKAEIDPEHWTQHLNLKDGSTHIKATIKNVSLVLTYDPLFRDTIALDEFTERIVLKRELPWDDQAKGRTWSDNDDTQLLRWFEDIHGMANKAKMAEGLAAAAYDCRFNSVANYLAALTWDNTPRAARILIDYLGADDSEYVRQVTSCWLVGAIGRAVKGGTKFDNVPILTGKQGIGKTTFLERLGKQWFLNLNTFEGKEAMENISGKWIVEIGELASFTKSEMSVVKGFLSKRFDSYRAPYGRRTEDHPRRCVFMGTTNEEQYLRDATGNRRFLPIELNGVPTKSIFNDLTSEVVDQIWAESYQLYLNGASTELEGEAKDEATKRQGAHEIEDTWEGIILGHLDRPRPPESLWKGYDLNTRRGFYEGGFTPDIELELPQITSIAEIWCECFGKDKAALTRRESMRISNVLKKSGTWEKGANSLDRGYAGRQNSYRRASPV